MLHEKKILIGITGGIAAYKIPLLIRLLKKNKAQVKCVMTPCAVDFVSPLTVSTLSEEPVHIDFWNEENGVWTNHVELGMWADLILIAPLTANTLSKIATGACDNLLTATYLSAKCPVMVAPAMDLDMYAHPTTTSNLATIKANGISVIPAEKGFLASGLEGEGRMAEPETLFNQISTFFSDGNRFKGQTILVTASPTYEAIDPVRFIGNHSSGKMGYAIAESLLNSGAKVILISGPTNCKLVHKNLNLIAVKDTDQMFKAVQKHFPKVNGGIFAAAVSDYKPATVHDKKIKKNDEKFTIELIKNPDILMWAGNNKSKNQWLVGFALETNNEKLHAEEKCKKKNLDAIVLNSLNDENAGFGHDTNKISIYSKDNNWKEFELTSKTQTAKNIVDFIFESGLSK